MAELTKIGPAHLRREAWVYVRQSTMTQVRENTESLKRQYELVERAHRLGWPADRVRVIDDDLGCSGAEATARVGFQGLVAAVGLGQVGLVLGIEVSRLARRNADWYHLLDLCAMTDTLIADADGLYHPGDYNDRLVLGLKGTMSEAELHVLRSRLDAGLRHKATRGELRQLLPVGLDYDEDGRIVVSPDEAVRAAIVAVFDRFDELGSARQVVLSLRADGLRLPRRSAGARLIRWAEATYPAVHDFLTNPAYGGAFVFGRTKVSRHLDETGRIVTRERELPLEDWEVTIPDHHPGYVSWQAYLANRERLRANARAPRGQGGGAVREGCAMLQGLVVCGKCGRRMLVSYSGPSGRVPRYVCAQGLRLYGSARSCQSLSGRRLDAAVVQEMFTVLQPAALAATAAALAEAEDQHARRVRAFELAVERARYEAERVRRQFDTVEPENRLVARSLESDWEARLFTLRQAEADLVAQRSRPPAVLTEEEVAWLSGAGADLRAVFDADSTTIRERKQLLRLLISEVVITVDRDAAQAAVRIRWEGGAGTDITVALPRRGVDSAIRTEADTGAHSAAGGPLRRRDDRASARTARRDDCDRAGVHPRPGWQPAPQTRHRRADRACRTRRRRCTHGQCRRSRDAVGHLPRHSLPVAGKRLHPRRATRPWRPVADPHRPRATRQYHPRHTRRMGRARAGCPPTRRGQTDRPGSNPPRRAQRRPRQPWPTQRPGHPTAADGGHLVHYGAMKRRQQLVASGPEHLIAPPARPWTPTTTQRSARIWTE